LTADKPVTTRKTRSCAATRRHLTAYIQHELATEQRRLVAAHFDHCDACYALYRQQRDLARELGQTLPLLGRPDRRRLTQMWTAVQGGLSRPLASPLQRDPARLGIAALILIGALTLPILIRQQHLSLSLPLPPTPAILVQETENLASNAATAVAGLPISLTGPTAAVTPPAGPNYAPPTDFGVTDTP
jgi:anti-sigma factor RsiW